MKNLEPWLQQRLDHLSDDDFAKCRDWLHSLPGGTLLEPELDSSSGLGWDASVLKNDLALHRERIASLRFQLAEAEAPSPPDREAPEAKARNWVASHAAEVSVKTGGGRFEVEFGSTSPLPLLCLIVPDTVAEALVTSVLTDRSAMVVDEANRQAEVARLRSDIGEFEHREEAIIRRLAAQGVTVARRSDAHPWIILGVMAPDTLARRVA